MKLRSNVILVGFMGAGKTTTGKELAKMLGFEFIDMDNLIEEKTEKEIKKIFEEDGEKHFRDLEKELIASLETKEKMVLSTGGGSWLSEENRGKFLGMGLCVWLKVSPQKAFQRLKSNSTQRPLLNSSKDPLKSIEELLAERDSLYSMANATIDTDEKKPKEVAVEIVKLLEQDNSFDLHSMQK